MAKGNKIAAPAAADNGATNNNDGSPAKKPILLAYPSANDATSLKVAWASKLYGVELRGGRSKAVKNSKTSLVLYNDQVVSGGGNAMAMALASLPSSISSHRLSLTDGLLCDEWCEWERTVLRPALKANNPKKVAAALQHVENTLQGVHLAGQHETLADVVVVSTLVTASAAGTVDLSAYPSLQLFVHSHDPAVQAAKETLAELVEAAKPKKLTVDLNEPSLYKLLTAIFQNAVNEMVEELVGEDLDSLGMTWSPNAVSRCSNPKHGDYQCNAIMATFAALEKSPTPLPATVKTRQDLAKLLVAKLGNDHEVFTEISVNGPGFVLVRIQSSFLERHVNKAIAQGKLPAPVVPHQTCLVDFSSPNIAKEMHVGHLRSTIIGESVCRVLEYVGHKVHRVNHVGDWGTQFGMLIQYLREEYPDVAGKDDGELPNITDLTVFYKNAKERFDESAEFKKASQMNVVDLQAGDPECHKIWKMLCDVSRREFNKIYDRLDVTLEEFGESFYNARIPPVIEELDQKGMLVKEEAGAKIVWIDGFQSPLMLQKTDGGFGYDSTDMAALKYRLFELGADRIIVITDFTQGDHFKMIYAAGRKAGWVQRNQQLEHIGFGTVQGEDGKRFKTRSGDTVRLVDLLDEACNRMKTSLLERIEGGKANISKDEVDETAAALGYSAVRYYDLKRNPTTDYKFSYDEMLSTTGDTAVYLMFATVRLESIATKVKAEHGIDVEELLKSGEPVVIGHPSERNLALHLQYFTDSILTTLDDLYPYHLCEFVYKLSIAATEFVTKCRVLGTPEMKSRLLLCHATTTAMRQAFDLLGLRHVKRI